MEQRPLQPLAPSHRHQAVAAQLRFALSHLQCQRRRLQFRHRHRLPLASPPSKPPQLTCWRGAHQEAQEAQATRRPSCWHLQHRRRHRLHVRTRLCQMLRPST